MSSKEIRFCPKTLLNFKLQEILSAIQLERVFSVHQIFNVHFSKRYFQLVFPVSHYFHKQFLLMKFLSNI